jgi:DNA polymerase
MRDTYLFDYLVSGSEKQKRPSAIPPQAVSEPLTMERLATETAACSCCRLRGHSTKVVFGAGSAKAKLLLVGEWSSIDDDRQGLPFAGDDGQLLSKILEAVQITSEEVYITNVVKCRPPEDRMPQKDEVEACLPHLRRQIDLLDPAIIVCLGNLATQALIDTSAQVSEVRGRWYEKDGIRLMATFHPAELLVDLSKKRPVWKDIQKIRDAFRSL